MKVVDVLVDSETEHLSFNLDAHVRFCRSVVDFRFQRKLLTSGTSDGYDEIARHLANLEVPKFIHQKDFQSQEYPVSATLCSATNVLAYHPPEQSLHMRNNLLGLLFHLIWYATLLALYEAGTPRYLHITHTLGLKILTLRVLYLGIFRPLKTSYIPLKD